MTEGIHLAAPVAAILQKSFANRLNQFTSDRVNAVDLSRAIYSGHEYTDLENAEMNKWIIEVSQLGSLDGNDSTQTTKYLSLMNSHLRTRTTILGSKPSVADIAFFACLSPLVSKWSDEQRTGENGYHNIVRHLDFVQNAPLFGLKLENNSKVDVDPDHVVVPVKPVDPKAEKQKVKKGADIPASAPANAISAKELVVGEGKNPGQPQDSSKETSTTSPSTEPPKGKADQGQKKQKQQKQPKQTKGGAVSEKPFSPALIDLRVGHIIKAENHPNADSLYVSTIACGDPPGTENTSEYEGTIVRTVCSGLNGLVPLEEMQGRKVVTVCNLKPVTMRGIKSAAMVLAASPRLSPGEEDHHKGPVELVIPPPDSEAGDRVSFEGWEGEPEVQLNPKKKVWENCQVGFLTTDSCEVGFDAAPVEQLAGHTGVSKLTTSKGVCTVKSLKGATVR